MKHPPAMQDRPLRSDSSDATGPIILRLAPEVTTKSRRTRHWFSTVLRRNIEDALKRADIPHEVSTAWSRIFVHTPAPAAALGTLRRVFGIGSLSPVDAICEATLDAIVGTGGALYAEQVRGRTYAVRAKRLGPCGFSHMDVERQLGAALNADARVDLERPDITVFVEIIDGKAYFFTQRIAGAGGLPTGIQGRALVLISGGFDSAVAAWRIMRRGVEVDYLFCNLGGSAYERLVLQVVKVLSEAWGFGQQPKFHIIDFAPVLDALRGSVDRSYWQVVLKRLMYRAGAEVASEIDASALVTGEAIGQVSSQTIKNLCAIDACVELPVLRPLIAMEKQEIVDEALRIGTAPLSARIAEYCAIASGHPVVACSKTRLDRQEARLDLAVLTEAVSSRKVIDVNAVTAADLRTPYLFVDRIPADATLIDCQAEHLYAAWHAPDAEHHDPDELLREHRRRLEKGRPYVLYCTWGTRTPYLAEVLQQSGYEVYAFDGGVKALRAYLERRAA